MDTNFFNKDGWNDTKPFPDRREMEDYIKSHFRYWTMSSWNRAKSYANNVKIHNLGLNKQELDKAFDLIASDNTEFNFDVQYLIDQFTQKFPFYTAGFNGRSSGYIVLYKRDYAKNGKLVTYPGRSIDDDLDGDSRYVDEFFNELDDRELRDTFEILKAFDTLCDDIRALFIDYLHRYKTREVTVLRPSKEVIAFCPDNDDIAEGLGVIIDKDLSDYNITVRYDAVKDTYIAAVPSLGLDDINGESLEQAVMWAEKSIMDHLSDHPDANPEA